MKLIGVQVSLKHPIMNVDFFFLVLHMHLPSRDDGSLFFALGLIIVLTLHCILTDLVVSLRIGVESCRGRRNAQDVAMILCNQG